MPDKATYETIIGLEVHAQLLTKSKLFCGDSTAFGSEPNTQVSPITLAHPGSLPKMNKKAIEFAVKMGLVCQCEIERENYFARKNYFYPDLPKGYQVSQHTTPICKGGIVKIIVDGKEKDIRLNRIHLEEDAGKSIHDIDEENTCIDYNRAGTPLIEIVSEPDIRSAEETMAYLAELRKIVRYLEICDGNMEEGSFRCDVNISVRKKGETKLGTRVEVKNLNSIRNAKRAVEWEAKRLIALLENGEKVIQQTRSFDANTGTTFSIRDKEDADDYRYFADPDLTPFKLEDNFIEAIRDSIPPMQQERIKKYTSSWQLSEYDAQVLTEDREMADYFEQVVTGFLNGREDGPGNRPKSVANWMLGPVKSWLNENNKEIGDFPVDTSRMGSLVQLVEDGKLSFSVASARVFPHLLREPSRQPLQIATEQNLFQDSAVSSLEPLVDEVLSKFAEKVKEYKKGKKGLLSLFVGEVMKQSKGKADPKITSEILLEKLKS